MTPMTVRTLCVSGKKERNKKMEWLDMAKQMPKKIIESNIVRKTVPVDIQPKDYESKDQKARKAGFLPLLSGEVFERQYSRTSHVFVMVESNKWNTHRETWEKGKSQSISQKQIATGVSFDMALLKAKQYIGYLTKRR